MIDSDCDTVHGAMGRLSQNSFGQSSPASDPPYNIDGSPWKSFDTYQPHGQPESELDDSSTAKRTLNSGNRNLCSNSMILLFLFIYNLCLNSDILFSFVDIYSCLFV